MLSRLEIHATLPVQDINRAKKFYADKLDLRPQSETPAGLVYQCKDSWFILFPSTGSSSGTFTQLGWSTDNIEAEVAELKARGLEFIDYDFPNFKTVNSIAVTGDTKAAWFKDSEGNLLGIVQLSQG